MSVEASNAAALRVSVRRFWGMWGCGSGMRRTEVRDGVGMFEVFVGMCTMCGIESLGLILGLLPGSEKA